MVPLSSEDPLLPQTSTPHNPPKKMVMVPQSFNFLSPTNICIATRLHRCSPIPHKTPKLLLVHQQILHHKDELRVPRTQNVNQNQESPEKRIGETRSPGAAVDEEKSTDPRSGLHNHTTDTPTKEPPFPEPLQARHPEMADKSKTRKATGHPRRRPAGDGEEEVA